MTINEWCRVAHENSMKHGFGENPLPTRLMLIVTEASEAMEDWRNDRMAHFPEEVADICLRVFDLAGWLGLDLEQVIETKHRKNTERPYQHGGKRA